MADAEITFSELSRHDSPIEARKRPLLSWHPRCSTFEMHNRKARLLACSEWLMEFSVLWAVFPLLDQLLRNEPIDVALTAFSLGISWIAFVGGILLRRGDVE